MTGYEVELNEIIVRLMKEKKELKELVIGLASALSLWTDTPRYPSVQILLEKAREMMRNG